MGPLQDSSVRRERVTAQYDTAQAAASYARIVDDGSCVLGRTVRSRLHLVHHLLGDHPGGRLLDAGCGPGMMARLLLQNRPGDFSITVLDQSPAMIRYCTENVRSVGSVHATVGQLEALPFSGANFDVALVMGALEYVDMRAAIREISRVTRPGGLVIVTMLNPLSPYRLTEWLLYWPLVRLLGVIEMLCGVPRNGRHGARHSGIRTVPPGRLQARMRRAGLTPVDRIHYDVTPLVPPLDRLPAIVRRTSRIPFDSTVRRGGWRRWLGTAYLVVARRE
jgi:ubiquinone/menaquinone biosynthesis C-methylase UbiE